MDSSWSAWLLREEIYDAAADVDGFFPREFRKYVQKQNLLCLSKIRERKRRSRPVVGPTDPIQNYWLFENKNQPYCTDYVTSAFRSLPQKMSNFFNIFIHRKFLIQFWRAEEVAANSANDFGDRRFQLTTRNQPFLIGNTSREKQINEEICWYRMKTHDMIITGDGRGGGPISRAFKNKRIEITPDVKYYSYEEYPQRDLALSCNIRCFLIVPLSDSYGRTVGVTEFVFQLNWPPSYYMHRLLENDMMYFNPCKGLCGKYDLDKDSLRIAVSEIMEVIGVLCRSFDIVTAQTWMLCKHCNSLTTSKGCAKELGASYQGFLDSTYVNLGCYCILREGEGVVGRAAVSSHNLVYCENVAKFTITEYPLAHIVRKNNLSASFAICLQSNLSGDQVYVLEFFLGPSYVSWGLRKKLVPILDKMRQWLRTFKVAYRGEEVGDNLSVLVVDASSPDKVETLKNESMVPVASESTVQSEIRVTVKANYGGDFFRFQLSASSGIHELNHLVSQRLELMEGTYDLSYQDDDNDLILLTCDEDLQFYISSSTEQGNYTLMVLIEPKRAPPL